MVKRFRMVAGPNGSGKSSLVRRLRDDYSVANRHAQGGHNVPEDKIASRYPRSLAQLKAAIPYLSRAYVFDNSGSEMLFLGEYDRDSGWTFAMPADAMPAWFAQAVR